MRFILNLAFGVFLFIVLGCDKEKLATNNKNAINNSAVVIEQPVVVPEAVTIMPAPLMPEFIEPAIVMPLPSPALPVPLPGSIGGGGGSRKRADDAVDPFCFTSQEEGVFADLISFLLAAEVKK